MVLSLTSFKNQYDNVPQRLDFESFDQFEKFLYLLAERPLKGKKDAELISPAVFVTDENSDKYPDAIKEVDKRNPNLGAYYHRKNRNVTGWAGWAAVDVDDVTYDGEIEDALRSRIGDWRYVVYSTASSKITKPKFRIVFQTSRFVDRSEIRAFWYALQSRLDDGGDTQCKDLSRMYFTPAKYADAHNFIFSNPGTPIGVDQLLKEFPYLTEEKPGSTFMDRLPSDLQAKVIEYRKNQMSAQFSWSSYSDCPFWPQRMAQEYVQISSTGWYHKMYQIMVAIASRAIKKNYPISSQEIAELCREFDRNHGNWYENRPLELEADRALEYAYRKT